jgi:flagellar hook protein FlgE
MSFQSALSGLNASSRNLDVIGNNIANANTVGMKSSRTEFADLVASSLGVGGSGSGGAGIGVSVATVSQQFSQGNITITGNDLDVAINGGGFFKVQLPDESYAYTRDGEFKLDKSGNIITNSGSNLMGYATDINGVASSSTLVPLSLPTSAPIGANATTEIIAEFNLDGSAPIATSVTGVTAAYTSGAITNFDFSVPVPTPSLASGTYTQPTSTNIADAYQFTLDGVVISDRLMDGSTESPTAANLDIDIAAYVAAMDPTYTQTGTVAGGDLVITKNDGSDLVIGKSFSDGVGSLATAAGTTAAGTFANRIIGTHTGGTISGERSFTVSGPGGTPMTVTLDNNSATQPVFDIASAVTAIQTSAGYAASGLTVSASGDNLVFTASSANKSGAITFGGTSPTLVTNAGTSVAGVTATAAEPTPRSTYGTSLTAYDSKGIAVPVNLYFTKVTPYTAGTDEWAVYDSATGPSVGSLVFDTSGKLQSNTVGSLMLTPPQPSVVPPFPVTVDFSKVTQYGGAFAVSNLTQDGYAQGNLVGLAIGEDGKITARYSNGETQINGQISLTDFTNVQGLAPTGGGNWLETFASGQPLSGSPGTGKFGALRSGAVEESNVDLTAELVNMMTAQRAYQANAQTIKTQDQIMSTLVNLR